MGGGTSAPVTSTGMLSYAAVRRAGASRVRAWSQLNCAGASRQLLPALRAPCVGATARAARVAACVARGGARAGGDAQRTVEVDAAGIAGLVQWRRRRRCIKRLRARQAAAQQPAGGEVRLLHARVPAVAGHGSGGPVLRRRWRCKGHKCAAAAARPAERSRARRASERQLELRRRRVEPGTRLLLPASACGAAAKLAAAVREPHVSRRARRTSGRRQAIRTQTAHGACTRAWRRTMCAASVRGVRRVRGAKLRIPNILAAAVAALRVGAGYTVVLRIAVPAPKRAQLRSLSARCGAWQPSTKGAAAESVRPAAAAARWAAGPRRRALCIELAAHGARRRQSAARGPRNRARPCPARPSGGGGCGRWRVRSRAPPAAARPRQRRRAPGCARAVWRPACGNACRCTAPYKSTRYGSRTCQKRRDTPVPTGLRRVLPPVLQSFAPPWLHAPPRRRHAAVAFVLTFAMSPSRCVPHRRTISGGSSVLSGGPSKGVA
jgi:hypothetical protein